MMAKFKQIEEQDNGWSDWQIPIMSGYRMACCDCNLVHDMDFSVLKVTKFNNDSFQCEELDIKNYRIRLKVKRNNRSTAQLRRYAKLKVQENKVCS